MPSPYRENLISGVLKPPFLPRFELTERSYVVDIHGKWVGGRYRFMRPYRSGMDHNSGEEFDAPFARIELRGS